MPSRSRLENDQSPSQRALSLDVTLNLPYSKSARIDQTQLEVTIHTWESLLSYLSIVEHIKSGMSKLVGKSATQGIVRP